jgi:hypothetical protein
MRLKDLSPNPGSGPSFRGAVCSAGSEVCFRGRLVLDKVPKVLFSC